MLSGPFYVRSRLWYALVCFSLVCSTVFSMFL